MKESRPYGVVLLEGYTVELVNDARIMKKLKRDVDQVRTSSIRNDPSDQF